MKEEVLSSLKKFMDGFEIAVPEGVMVKGRRVYLASTEVQSVVKQTLIDPYFFGLPLGEAKPKGFEPSLALLDLLKETENKVTISNDAEWLFTCGRDIFVDKVKFKGKTKGTFLVENERKEVLGLGIFSRDGQNKFVKNMLDRGDFLRREDHKKKKKKV